MHTDQMDTAVVDPAPNTSDASDNGRWAGGDIEITFNIDHIKLSPVNDAGYREVICESDVGNRVKLWVRNDLLRSLRA